MDKINVQQTGGFPMETDTLDFMQKAYLLLNNLGFLSGNGTIISGCVQTGSNVSDGVVFYNGELLPFQGGAIQSTVIIVEEEEPREFQDGGVKMVYKKRYMKFGAVGSGVGINWSGFQRPYNLKTITDKINALPVFASGMIVEWSGALNEIPAGWQLCDGTNGTQDRRDRFVVGYNPVKVDYNEVGKTGGLEKVTLTESQIPSHNHTGITSTDGAHTHTYAKAKAGRGYRTQKDDYPFSAHENVNTQSAGSHNHRLTINNTGGSQPHENRPPYLVTCWIQWVGV